MQFKWVGRRFEWRHLYYAFWILHNNAGLVKTWHSSASIHFRWIKTEHDPPKWHRLFQSSKYHTKNVQLIRCVLLLSHFTDDFHRYFSIFHGSFTPYETIIIKSCIQLLTGAPSWFAFILIKIKAGLNLITLPSSSALFPSLLAQFIAFDWIKRTPKTYHNFCCNCIIFCGNNMSHKCMRDARSKAMAHIQWAGQEQVTRLYFCL